MLWISIPFWSDFNPTPRSGFQGLLEFQSHFGLILTAVEKTIERLVNGFQSHFGLILTRRRVTNTSGTSIPFQSHFGLILTYLCKHILAAIKNISIPFWSDFNLTVLTTFSSFFRWFQSHFGLILTRLSRTFSRTCLFQSHFGLILTRKSPTTSSPGYMISIPFWSDFNYEVLWDHRLH